MEQRPNLCACEQGRCAKLCVRKGVHKGVRKGRCVIEGGAGHT